MRALHAHWPRRTEAHGVNRYQWCRCGKRRVLRGARGYSAIPAGWSPRWSV